MMGVWQGSEAFSITKVAFFYLVNDDQEISQSRDPGYFPL